MVHIDTTRLQLAVTGLTQSSTVDEQQKHIEHVINAVLNLTPHRRDSLTVRKRLLETFARSAHRIDSLNLADNNAILDIQGLFIIDDLSKHLLWSSRMNWMTLDTKQETRS